MQHAVNKPTYKPINNKQSVKFPIIAVLKWSKYIVRLSIALVTLVVLYTLQNKVQSIAVTTAAKQTQLTTGSQQISAFEHSTGVQFQRPFSTHTSQPKPEQSFIYQHPKAAFSLYLHGFLQLYNGKIKAYIHFPERIFFCVYRL